MSGEANGNSGVASRVATGLPIVPNASASVIPVLNATTESALEATRVPPTRVRKSTSIDPGVSYWSTTVFVLSATTLVGSGSGGSPSRSTSPVGCGVKV